MASQKLSAQVLQEMIDQEYKEKYHKLASTYGEEVQGKSPSDISVEKANEIYKTLATPLKNMRAAAIKDSLKNCYKDRWMDDADPNPHAVAACEERMKNRHMGVFYRNLVNLRDSTAFKYKDCLKAAENDVNASMLCIRDYLAGIDADNVTLTGIVESQCSKYY